MRAWHKPKCKRLLAYIFTKAGACSHLASKELNLFLLKFLYKYLCTDYFYKPYRKMIWHPIYKDKSLTTEKRREIRENQLPNEWNWNVWDRARNHWQYRCAACGSDDLYLQQDHLVPVAHRDCPGAVPSNLLPLCEKCNKDKGATDFAEWYERTYDFYPERRIQLIHEWQTYCLTRGWN